LMWGAFSDERTGQSFTIPAAPRQHSHSRVRFPWDSRPYFTASDSRLPFSSPGRSIENISCPAMDTCKPHTKLLFLYCIYSALHGNGSYRIVACVFVVAYCLRLYLVTGCLPRICLRGTFLSSRCLAMGICVTIFIFRKSKVVSVFNEAPRQKDV
jgi:hypothetical protein